jgi:L-malate glycosyltransferase
VPSPCPDDRSPRLSIFVAHPSSLLTDHQPHGDGLLAHRFIAELAARGHRLHVAAEAVDLREPLPPSVRVYTLGRPGAGGRVGYMLKLRRLFHELLRREAIHVIHQLNPVHAGLSLALAGTSVPIVLGPYVPDWPDRRAAPASLPGALGPATDALRSGVARLQQSRADVLLLSSPAAGSKIRVGPRATPVIHELPYGIDERLWAPDDHRPLGQDVLFVGRVHAHKGVFVLLAAFEAVAARRPDARLLIAGAGPAMAELEARIDASPARPRIELLGNLPRQQTVRAVQACDLYCLPSFAEPFGLGALEAMACGKPVVATDAGGLRHLVDEKGGRRVPVGDSLALAAALDELIGDPDRRQAMGRHNRHRVEARYSWSRVVDRLQSIYAQAIAA